MNEKAIIRLVRSATLKINYAGHTILVDPVFADKGTLQSALACIKVRVHLDQSAKSPRAWIWYCSHTTTLTIMNRA